MRYQVRLRYEGKETISAPLSVQEALEAAIVLSAAGREVSVTDQAGALVDIEAIADAVRQGSSGPSRK